MIKEKLLSIVLLELTSKIISSYVVNNSIPAGELPKLISDTHTVLTLISSDKTQNPAPVTTKKPAISINKSIQQDHLTCLEDGKQFKSLKRHLAARHGMTPEEYRSKWDLPPTYPMTAPGYSQARSALAKEFGLGRTAPKSIKPRAGFSARRKLSKPS